MDKKLIFIDLDGTLSPTSTWYELNIRLGITPEEDAELFDKYVKGNLSYAEWNRELVRLYKSKTPVSKEEILSFTDSIELRPDAVSTVQALREKGYRVVILSGSVDLIVQVIARKVTADDWRSASKFVFDENNLLENVTDMGDEAPAKKLLADEYVAANGYVLADTYAVEDGGNGVELFKYAKGILLGDNEKLKPLAWKQVQSLSEIPDLLN
jgi:phosphoserine phosphatase